MQSEADPEDDPQDTTQPETVESYVRERVRDLDTRATNAQFNLEPHGHKNHDTWFFYFHEAGRLALSLPRFAHNLSARARSKVANEEAGQALESNSQVRDEAPEDSINEKPKKKGLAIWALLAYPYTLAGSRSNAMGLDIGRDENLTTDEENADYDKEVATYIISLAEALAAGFTPGYYPPDTHFTYAGCVTTEEALERGLTGPLRVGAALPESVLTTEDLCNRAGAIGRIATGWIPGDYANGELAVFKCPWKMGDEQPRCLSAERNQLLERSYLENTSTGRPEVPATPSGAWPTRKRATRLIKMGNFVVSMPAVSDT